MTAPAYHYGRGVRRCTYQLLDLLNEMQIKRYDPSGNVEATIVVPIKFGPADKLYWELYQDANDTSTINPLNPLLSLPRMGLTFRGFEKSINQRVNNLYFPVYYEDSSGSPSKTLLPINAKYHYMLSMAAKYLDDLLQLYEQVFALFYPVLYVEMPMDELALGQMSRWDVKVEQIVQPHLDVDDSRSKMENSFWRCDIHFNCEGWVYKYQHPPSTTFGPIYRVSGNVLSLTTSAGETVIVSAVPSAISAYHESSASYYGTDEDYYQAIQPYYITGV
jgi:hypothetical protein